jgi:hypothetical protein
VLLECAARIAEAEKHPFDEPLLRAKPAARAAELASACLASLVAAQRNDPEVGGALLIRRANALRLLGHGRDAEARESFEAALALAPERAGWWYDLALLHKHRGRWREALGASARALELGGENEAVLFNHAIAATALGEGETAAECLRKLGLPARVNTGGMPVVDGLSPATLRLPARSSGHTTAGDAPKEGAVFEVVWAAPISPLHGVIVTPTFRDAPADYGDVVLWDAAPVAIHEVDGDRVPRFALLEILRRGDERRLRFVGLQQRAGEIDRLADVLPGGSSVFVQSERIEHLCVRCASGEVLTKHEHTTPEEHRIVYGKIVLAASADLAAVRDTIEREARTRGTFQVAVPELYEQLGDTKRAGQEHQAWRGIERVAIRKGLA